MTGSSPEISGRTFLAGKVIFNYGQSSIDCIVRRIADEGATIEAVSGLGVPDSFQLVTAARTKPLACKVAWRSEKQIGVTFLIDGTEGISVDKTIPHEDTTSRREMLALRASLEHVPLGIVLLDSKLTARFINRAF